MRISCGIVSTLTTLALLLAAPSEGRKPEPLPLRVVTYNIHGFYPLARTDEGKAVVRRVVSASQVTRRLALELALHKPDIISLQEAASEKRVAELARHLGMNYAYFPGGWKGKGWPEGISGAVLTRFEIVESRDCPVYPKEERPKDIYSRHCGRVLLRVGDEEVVVFSAHLLPSWANTTHIRKQEIEGIVSLVSADRKKGRSVLVLGDMNHTPAAPEHGFWTSGGLVDTFAKAGAGPKLTCPSDVPKERIDYIWAAGPVASRLKSVRVLFEGAFRTNPQDRSSFALSDHLPVLAVFE